MLKKIETIKKFGVFDDFKWNDEVRGNGGSVQCFKDINIIYGRNYSGKTTLSRIIRSLETGQVPEGYEAGSFDLKFTDGSNISQNDLVGHGKTVRVFNEDFVRKNLRFIVNPDESIEPFAVLGQDNNQIEQEIKRLENELGSNEAGHETGLFSNYVEAKRKLSDIKDEYDEDVRKLEKQLQDKATTRKKGIKYQSERTQFMPADVYYISEVPSRLDWNDVWHVGVMAFGLSFLATIYPAWSASRVQPAEALRYE